MATASLSDVAEAFGITTSEGDELRLTGTTLGVGLAVIRLGSLAALPLASRADRAGRRALILICTCLGLALTAVAALAPGFWWFVAILALARPLLSAANAVAVVISAEVTRTDERSKAVALVGAAYALGAGTTVLLRAAGGEALGFRLLFALSVVPLVMVLLSARRITEPKLFTNAQSKALPSIRFLLNPVPPAFRGRLALICLLTGAAALVTGPANTFVFFFAESVQNLDRSVMAQAVLAAGPLGLAGLVAGRWTADHLGRRVSSAVALAGVSVAAIVTYSSGPVGVVVGYLGAMFAAAVYTPASGALSTELFPTSMRSTAAGWITASGVLGAVAGLALFGILADTAGSFAMASVYLAGPVILLSLLYIKLPETRGRELEEVDSDLPIGPIQL
ncbi:MAG: MFS transporter [Actinobacteria bacterium]|nr:MFS transporter [Actinomycetota bacterium]